MKGTRSHLLALVQPGDACAGTKVCDWGNSERRGPNLWLDNQTVPGTGFETLSERLWEPLLSVAGAADPRRGLTNLRLMARDEAGVDRATVAGILLCAPSPAGLVVACDNHGNPIPRTGSCLGPTGLAGDRRPASPTDCGTRSSSSCATCVFPHARLRNGKTSSSTAKAAVFEAVVNAVGHRDYSMSSRRIRLSMFKDRLEIDSPGQLPNGMTIEGMEASQATRNEVIASVFGRIPVANVAGSDHRGYLMERRGDGVSIIRTETREATGLLPEYEVIDGSSVVLRIPAAKLELVPADADGHGAFRRRPPCRH